MVIINEENWLSVQYSAERNTQQDSAETLEREMDNVDQIMLLKFVTLKLIITHTTTVNNDISSRQMPRSFHVALYANLCLCRL